MKALLLQLDGHGHPKDNATPSFFPDSKNSTVELSNELSYVSEIFWKGGKIVCKLLGSPKIWPVSVKLRNSIVAILRYVIID